MQIILEKRLSASEKERHWIIVPYKTLANFPPIGVEFNINIGGEVFITYIDKYNRLRIGSRAYNKLDEPDGPMISVVLERISDKEYVLKKNNY